MPVQVNTQYGPAELNSEWFDKYGKVRDTRGHGNVVRAISTLRKLTTSPAGVFVAGQGYLQTPGNLLTYSNDLTNAAWLKNGTAAAPSASVGNMPANNDYFYEVIPNQTTSTLLTVGAVLSGSGTVELSYFNTVDAAARGLLVVTLTATPTLYATNLTTAAATGTTYIRVGRVGASYTATSMTVGGMGTFLGTYTASQLLAMGGIPLTTSAAVAPVYTNASVYQGGSTQVSYGAELASASYAAPGGYDNVVSAVTANSFSSTAGTGGDTRVFLNIATVVGATYVVNCTTTISTTGTVFCRAGSGGLGTILSSLVIASGVPAQQSFVATSTASSILWSVTPTSTFSSAGISVREKITTSSVINSLTAGDYTLSDGSTGFSAVDGSAGLVLDGMGSVGSELVTNGDFSAGSTGWIGFGAGGWSVSGGVATHTAGTYGIFQSATCAVTTGSTYLVSFDVTLTAGDVKCYIAGTASSTFTTGGTKQVIIVAGANLTYTIAIEPSTSFAGTVDNISVKQVTGIHATQSTAGNRPSVRRGLLNLLLQSRDYSTTWSVVASGATVATNVALAPDGTMTADALVEVAGITYGFNQTSAASGAMTFAALVKANAKSQVFLQPNSGGSYFNLATGAVGFLGASCTASSIASVGNGWYLCVINFVSASTPLQIYAANAGSIGYTGVAGTQAIYLSDSGLFTGTLTAQQILDSGGIPLTTAAAASNPNAGRYSLEFNGTKSLALGSVPFQMADDHAVIAACTVNTTSASVLFSENGGLNPRLQLYTASNNLVCDWADDAATSASANRSSVATVGANLVASMRKVANNKIVRSNGTAGTANNTVLGTTTLTNSRIGCNSVNAVDANFYNGNISIVIAIKGTLSDAEMLVLERFAASTLPNAPVF